MNSRKKRQPLLSLRRVRTPAHERQLGGPIVEFIELLEQTPSAARAEPLRKLAQRFVAEEGVYSIVKHESNSIAPAHSHMSLVSAMCRQANPELLAQWNQVVLACVLDHSANAADATRLPIQLVQDALRAQRPDVALDMLERVLAWHATQPQPQMGSLRKAQGAQPGLLRNSSLAQACVGGLIAQMPDDAGSRARLLAMVASQTQDAHGYMVTRISNVLDTIEDPQGRCRSDFTDNALRNITAPEYTHYVNPCRLLWASLNACSPEGLSYALRSSSARDKLEENIETVEVAITEFAVAWGEDPSINQDMDKFEQLLGVLIEHAPASFPDNLSRRLKSEFSRTTEDRPDHLISMVDKVILSRAVPHGHVEKTTAGPRL